MVDSLSPLALGVNILLIDALALFILIYSYRIYCTARPTQEFRQIRIYAISLAVHWLVDLFASFAYVTVAYRTSAPDAIDTCLKTSSVDHPEIKDPQRWCNASTKIVLATLIGVFITSKILSGCAYCSKRPISE
jgi:hypothetical protein